MIVPNSPRSGETEAMTASALVYRRSIRTARSPAPCMLFSISSADWPSFLMPAATMSAIGLASFLQYAIAPARSSPPLSDFLTPARKPAGMTFRRRRLSARSTRMVSAISEQTPIGIIISPPLVTKSQTDWTDAAEESAIAPSPTACPSITSPVTVITLAMRPRSSKSACGNGEEGPHLIHARGLVFSVNAPAPAPPPSWKAAVLPISPSGSSRTDPRLV